MQDSDKERMVFLLKQGRHGQRNRPERSQVNAIVSNGIFCVNYDPLALASLTNIAQKG
jgi:hypothetical protein